MDFYLSLGLRSENLRFRDHEPTERAHYARAATDIEYNAPWGWSEFMGIHHRGDWDLSRHQQFSGQDMSITDPQTNQKYNTVGYRDLGWRRPFNSVLDA